MYDKEIVTDLKKRNLTVFEEVYQLRAEIVMGCNLSCEFCGRTKSGLNLMTKETFFQIFKGATSRLKRIELTGQGEPSLHPELPGFIMWLRDKFPKSQLLIYTNSEVYRSKNDITGLLSLFDCGLNLLQVDLYNETTKDWILDMIRIHKNILNKKGIRVYNFYKDRFNPWSFKSAEEKMLIIADETKGFNYYAQTTRNAHTFGGNLAYKNWKGYISYKMKDFPLNKICSEPLKYMTIGWNGDVYLCCTDGAKAIIIDNVYNKNINEIWQSDKFHKLRLALKAKRRDLIPCCVLCNVNSVRSGLYAYWGKKFSLFEVIEEIENCTKEVKEKEPLIQNLKDLNKLKYLPENIQNYIRSYT